MNIENVDNVPIVDRVTSHTMYICIKMYILLSCWVRIEIYTLHIGSALIKHLARIYIQLLRKNSCISFRASNGESKLEEQKKYIKLAKIYNLDKRNRHLKTKWSLLCDIFPSATKQDLLLHKREQKKIVKLIFKNFFLWTKIKRFKKIQAKCIQVLPVFYC